MNASMVSSNETQATQIINAVIPQTPEEARACQEKVGRRSQQLHEGSGRHELSLGSSQHGHHAQYHYFGLVSTQTDSQVDGLPNGCSLQKENAPASMDVDELGSNPSLPSRSPDPNKRSERDTPRDVNTHEGAQSEIAPKPTRAVTFRSPVNYPLATPQRPGGVERTGTAPARGPPEPRRQRSPSPASQDSFAGPLPPDEAEKLFVANTKAFNIPISELGWSNTDDFSSMHTPSSSMAGRARSSIPINRRIPLPASRPLQRIGEILVAETPSSHSSNSQEAGAQSLSGVFPGSPATRSQIRGGDTQPSGESQSHAQQQNSSLGYQFQGAALGDTQPSSPVDDVSTEPSSSYERLLRADPFAPNPEAYVATQPATQISSVEATQEADVARESDPSTALHGHEPCDFIDRQYPAPSPGPSTATTSTRTIHKGMAGLIPTSRRRMYRMEEGVPLALPPHPPLPAPQISHTEDTQLSDTRAVHGSAATSIPHMPPPPLPMPHRPAAPAKSQDVEVVPDSEPMDVDEGGPGPGPVDHDTLSKHHLRSVSLPADGVVLASVLAESEEEDELPLAAVVSGKGKRMAEPQSRIPRQKSSTAESPTRGIQEPLDTPEVGVSKLANVRSSAKRGRATRGRLGAATVVPTSKALDDVDMPIADLDPYPTVPIKHNSGLTRRSRGHSKVKSRSTTPVVAFKARKASAEEPCDDATAVIQDTESTVLDERGEGDTELADDDCMDVDGDAPRSRTVRMAKRKRINSGTDRGAVSRNPARNTKTTLTTPLGRSSKWRKVFASSEQSATRVYAIWKQDGHYYPGIVYSLASTNPLRYKIHFDDDTEDVVEITKMRLCQFVKGDRVLVLPNDQKATVSDTTHVDTDHMVTVEIDNGEELDRVDVELKDVRIASRTVASTWTNRTLTVDTIFPVIKHGELKDSPSPSKFAVGSAGSIKTARRILSRTGFVVTLSAGNDDREKDKDRIVHAVKASGGTVIDDWTDIFVMDGAHSQGGKRWAINHKDVKCLSRDDVDRVFLLSDDANAKPKYLIALALGIPCLSMDWLLQSVEARDEKDWHQFLLPAGFSDTLNARVSQLVDFDWGNSAEHLCEIMSNPVASKLFQDKRILCVAPDFVPAKSKRNSSDTDKGRESTRMVPRIILAMGASRVEAVPDVKYASSQDLSKYDYVVVKDNSDIGRAASGPNCVHLGWVKDCLIAGRLLRQPDY